MPQEKEGRLRVTLSLISLFVLFDQLLLWRDKPQTILSLNETENSKGPLGIRVRRLCVCLHSSYILQFSCKIFNT